MLLLFTKFTTSTCVSMCPLVSYPNQPQHGLLPVILEAIHTGASLILEAIHTGASLILEAIRAGASLILEAIHTGACLILEGIRAGLGLGLRWRHSD